MTDSCSWRQSNLAIRDVKWFCAGGLAHIWCSLMHTFTMPNAVRRVPCPAPLPSQISTTAYGSLFTIWHMLHYLPRWLAWWQWQWLAWWRILLHTHTVHACFVNNVVFYVFLVVFRVYVSSICKSNQFISVIHIWHTVESMPVCCTRLKSNPSFLLVRPLCRSMSRPCHMVVFLHIFVLTTAAKLISCTLCVVMILHACHYRPNLPLLSTLKYVMVTRQIWASNTCVCWWMSYQTRCVGDAYVMNDVLCCLAEWHAMVLLMYPAIGCDDVPSIVFYATSGHWVVQSWMPLWPNDMRWPSLWCPIGQQICSGFQPCLPLLACKGCAVVLLHVAVYQSICGCMIDPACVAVGMLAIDWMTPNVLSPCVWCWRPTYLFHKYVSAMCCAPSSTRM